MTFTTHLLQGAGDAAGVSTACEDRLGSAAMAAGWRGQRSGVDAVQRMVVDGLASLWRVTVEHGIGVATHCTFTLCGRSPSPWCARRCALPRKEARFTTRQSTQQPAPKASPKQSGQIKSFSI